jgi:Flp pilus assembly protein TadD
MRLARILAAAALAAAAAVPATGAITVIGNSYARMCYEASESSLRGGAGIDYCDRALATEALTRYDTVATHVNRGILRLRRGDVDGAVADFDTATKLDPREPESYVNKGFAMLHRDDSETAIRLFEEGLQLGTRRPAIAYFGRAVAHEMQGRMKQALRDYRQASLLAPKWQDPKTQLARFTVKAR